MVTEIVILKNLALLDPQKCPDHLQILPDSTFACHLFVRLLAPRPLVHLVPSFAFSKFIFPQLFPTVVPSSLPHYCLHSPNTNHQGDLKSVTFLTFLVSCPVLEGHGHLSRACTSGYFLKDSFCNRTTHYQNISGKRF